MCEDLGKRTGKSYEQRVQEKRKKFEDLGLSEREMEEKVSLDMRPEDSRYSKWNLSLPYIPSRYRYRSN